MSGGNKGRKISNKSQMQVTFSKRRNGLFNKAQELFTLYGAYVALIIFSPTGKVFSFGLPDLDTVIDRYLSRAPRQDNDTRQFIEAFRSTNLRGLNDALDHEKRCRDDLIRIDEMNMDQLKLLKNGLEKMMKVLEELKKNVDQSTQRLE